MFPPPSPLHTHTYTHDRGVIFGPVDRQRGKMRGDGGTLPNGWPGKRGGGMAKYTVARTMTFPFSWPEPLT